MSSSSSSSSRQQQTTTTNVGRSGQHHQTVVVVFRASSPDVTTTALSTRPLQPGLRRRRLRFVTSGFPSSSGPSSSGPSSSSFVVRLRPSSLSSFLLLLLAGSLLCLLACPCFDAVLPAVLALACCRFACRLSFVIIILIVLSSSSPVTFLARGRVPTLTLAFVVVLVRRRQGGLASPTHHAVTVDAIVRTHTYLSSPCCPVPYLFFFFALSGAG